ncbi:hypothetical protein FR557_07220 [Campylobacter jejuni]|nr:hypothetical protein [Campylobacter jejuni]
MVKFSQPIKFLFLSFSPFLNFFMVKLIKTYITKISRFSPFLNFFMVKSRDTNANMLGGFSPFLNFFMVK